MKWLLLVASLTGQQSALRIRVWRALKACGAAPLRDGVYLAPATPLPAKALEEQRAEVDAAGGIAYVLPLSNLSAGDEASFALLFDRSEDYGALGHSIDELVSALPQRSEADARRALRQLKRELAGIEAIDFFPGSAKAGATNALREAEAALLRTFSPEEPAAIRAAIQRRDVTAYRGRIWATREHLWVDRVATAWLVRRFVDPDAQFLWLRRPCDCPADAVGFDFDGADFTHVEDRVTFEVVVESFELAGDAALMRLGAVVRSLDVGGDQVGEAAGFEAILAGARARCANDGALLEHISLVLDDLYEAFAQPKRARGLESSGVAVGSA